MEPYDQLTPIAEGQARAAVAAGMSEDDAEGIEITYKYLGSKATAHLKGIADLAAARVLPDERIDANVVLRDRTMAVFTPYEKQQAALEGKVLSWTQDAIARSYAHTPDPQSIAMEREIRDRLMTVDPLQRHAMYLAAIADKDEAFVRAVEGAPKRFALVDDETVKKGKQLKLEQSPEWRHIQAAKTHAELLGIAIGMGKRAVEEATMRAIGATSPDWRREYEERRQARAKKR